MEESKLKRRLSGLIVMTISAVCTSLIFTFPFMALFNFTIADQMGFEMIRLTPLNSLCINIMARFLFIFVV